MCLEELVPPLRFGPTFSFEALRHAKSGQPTDAENLGARKNREFNLCSRLHKNSPVVSEDVLLTESAACRCAVFFRPIGPEPRAAIN